MRIAARYSHLNGEEYLLVHRKQLWEEAKSYNQTDFVKARVAVEVRSC